MNDVDDAIRRYHCAQIGALDLVEDVGLILAPECDCGGRLRVWRADWACSRCGGEWPRVEVLLPRGVVGRASRCCRPIPAPRRGEAENAIAGLATFGYHLNNMLREDRWRWSTQALVGRALTAATHAEVAAHANAHGWATWGGGPWTEELSRVMTHRARRELSGRWWSKRSR